MMYDPDLKCGVLTDFDLSILQWEPRVIGTDRTGTVPFMAIDLLSEAYWRGLMKRLYRHELEAFIWVLPFTFLLYQDGMRLRNKYVDPWSTSDYNVCMEKKAAFLQESVFRAARLTVQKDFKDFWLLVYFLFRALDQAAKSRLDVYMESADLDEGNFGDAGLESKEMWEFVVSALNKFSDKMDDESGFPSRVARLQMHQPNFTELTEDEAALLRDKYADFASHPSSIQALP